MFGLFFNQSKKGNTMITINRFLCAALASSALLISSLGNADDFDIHKNGKKLTNLNLPNEVANVGVEVYKRRTKIDLLTDMNGRTLYTFSDDQGSGESACYDVCESFWPPLEVGMNDKLEKPFGVHVRRDGVRQLTFNDWPLYTFLHDVKSGDFNGYLFEGGGLGQWYIVRDKNAVLDDVTRMKLINDREKYLILRQRPLYFNSNVDVCVGACLDTWTPAFVELDEAGYPFGTIWDSSAEKSQLTYKGEPLYTFNFDNFVNITIGRNFFGTEWDIILNPKK